MKPPPREESAPAETKRGPQTSRAHCSHKSASAFNGGRMSTKRKHWSDALPKPACSNALSWARGQASAAVAWKSCKRGDWMLWLVGFLSGEPESDSRKRLVLAACECARLALPHVRKGEDRPRIAIETAEQWARGEDGVTLSQVRRAADDAAAYAYAAYAAKRNSVLAQCADIVRKHYPHAPRLK